VPGPSRDNATGPVSFNNESYFVSYTAIEPPTSETKAFRYELDVRGQDLRQFCDGAGLSFRYIQRQMGLNFPSPRVQASVEAALGYKPLWSKATSVALRKRLHECGQGDPGLLTLTELRTLARSLGLRRVHSGNHTNWPELLESVLGKMSVNTSSHETV
jgi:hypothetical protein